jgi:hypothetical protein
MKVVIAGRDVTQACGGQGFFFLDAIVPKNHPFSHFVSDSEKSFDRWTRRALRYRKRKKGIEACVSACSALQRLLGSGSYEISYVFCLSGWCMQTHILQDMQPSGIIMIDVTVLYHG